VVYLRRERHGFGRFAPASMVAHASRDLLLRWYICSDIWELRVYSLVDLVGLEPKFTVRS